MSAQPLIALRGVSKLYDTGGARVRALDGIDLTIRAGEFVAIVGSSGSGKSTLMHILGCLDRPSGGRYQVAGVEVSGLDSNGLAALRRDTFGFVFQRYNLMASASALENVELPAVYAGLPPARRHARAAALLARLGLGDRLAHRPGELSGGQQQRVSIARALMNDAPVILADEPTGALDSASGAEVLDLLDALNREGRTILLITHDPAVAARAHRIVRLHDGQVVEDRPATPPVAGTAPAPPSTNGAPAIGRRHAPSLPTMLGEAAVMALRALRANLFRTALTLLGVVIGVAAVIAMLAIGEGTSRDVVSRIQAMGADLLIVRPGGARVRPSGEIATLSPEDAEAIAALPGVVAVTPERTARLTLRSPDVDLSAPVTGVWPGYVAVRDWTLAEGAFFTDADLSGYAPVVVLGDTVARLLFPDWAAGNAPSPLGRHVMIRSVPFEVIGLLAPKGASPMGQDQDEVALVPLTTGFMRLFGRPFLHGITLKIDPAVLTQATVEALLRDRHGGKEDFLIRNTAAIIAAASETQGTLTALLGSVALISLLVGGIGVMNIMLVSVRERTREIGVRMATGARMGDILVQFNTEALVVCGIGGLAGVAAGLAAAAAAAGMGMPVAYAAGPPALAFACAFATGLVFGYLPARQAARLDPVIALASE